ncbi:SpoIIE family protein phosphatase [Quadrisphaera setariae]|uniref:SpoIIE family protein phosphatase n=1 Tax=Quadrisphaera setariae TaxID=2593304 RepID=A0A5C8ZE57_9ACTN|nr:SpoIIE family protein phosphatase [Quadrisphaera setariae]TXR56122.1 SpoIIE family protein phosphatase [Quadrisphaera setariae]
MSRENLRSVFDALPFACVLLDTDLVIVQVSGVYATTMGMTREQLVGRHLFDAFPRSDAAEEAVRRGAVDPVVLVRASLQRVLDTGQPDPVPLQKYDLPDARSPTGFSERWWSFTTFPVTEPLTAAAAPALAPVRSGAQGSETAPVRVSGLLHLTEDVTDEVARRTGLPAGALQAVAEEVQRSTALLRGRTRELEADLYARAVQVQALTAARETAASRLAGLARTALALAEARSVQDLTDQISDQGLAALGCDGGAVAIFTPGDATTMDLTITDGFGEATQRDYARLPSDSPLPACVAATTGRTVLLHDAAASTGWGPEMGAVMASSGSQAFACLPLTAGGHRLGALVAGWRDPQVFDAEQVELLSAFAAQCAQVLDRLLVAEAERAAALAAAAAWETLQRSLLTAPPEPDHAQVVVRYRAAARAAQVGGDWYDAFIQPDGSSVLVIGDVIGHDTIAAAAMGQVRTMLRSVAAHTGEGPAAVLTATDRLLRTLMLETSATALVARLEQSPDERARGVSRVRWSSAGHLPPLLIDGHGAVTLLGAMGADLMLGVDPQTPRHESEVTVDRGSTLLLYTDGLVERRGESLEVGLERLRLAAEDLAAAGAGLDDLVDGLLVRLVDVQGERADDDVALIAVRLHRQDRPRPAEAGPRSLPEDVAADG